MKRDDGGEFNIISCFVYLNQSVSICLSNGFKPIVLLSKAAHKYCGAAVECLISKVQLPGVHATV